MNYHDLVAQEMGSFIEKGAILQGYKQRLDIDATTIRTNDTHYDNS